MRLKHLELHGFKTFATRSEFVFPTGITAIVGPNGSGKCVIGDTLVTLANGHDVPIRDLVNAALNSASNVEPLANGALTRDNPHAIQILSLNPKTLRLEPRPVAGFIKRQAPPRLLRVRTRTGRDVTATPYHPFFTLDNGDLRTLKAEELKAGVRLALPRRLPVSGSEIDLQPFEVLEHFKDDDQIFVPNSERLRAWVDQARTRFRTWIEWTQTAGVPHSHLKGFLDGQAISTTTLVRLAHTCELRPPLDGQLKSHGSNQMGLPSSFTPDLARFLGLLVAEGRNTDSNQVWFVNSDPAVNNEFERLARTLFGVDVYRKHYKASAEDSLIFSHTLGIVLERLFSFPVKSTSAEKEIPPQLFEANAETQWAFLSGLFEGDAYICTRAKTNGKRRLAYIEYVSASPKLARQVVALLLRLGVFAILRSKQTHASNTAAKRRRTYYAVLIYGTEQLRYVAQHLSFVGEKGKALEALRELPPASNPNLDLIPGVTPLVKEAARMAGVKIKANRQSHPKLAAYVENRCEASRGGLLEVVDQIERLGNIPELAREHLSRLTTLATSDVYWDEIVSVEKVEPPDEWVYDLSVAGTHNFVAGNIIVHNSNIADAMRWVLGEQSFSTLRAKKTEDLVFAGGEGRARSGMAEAYLTLDNSDGFFPIDFSEVTIGRRAYRDGENEYLLNGSKVRLRDIAELLAKSGLARRTYTVVGQGLIDQALSLRAEERRALFEEAAGISLYQAKREDALRRLDETQRNLERVKDILAEIGPRVRQLERQARRAQDYARLSAELHQMQRTWFGYQWGRMQSTLREAKASAQAQASQLEQRRAELVAAGARLETLRRRQLDLRAQLSEWHRKSSGLHAQAEALQRELAVLSERARLLQQQADDARADMAPLELQIAAQAERATRAEADLAEIQDRIANQAQDIAAAQRALAERQTLRQSLLEAVQAAQNDRLKLQADMADLRNQRAQIGQRRAALEGEIAAHRNTITSLQTALANRHAELAAIQAESAQIESHIETRRHQSADLTQRLEAIRTRQNDLNGESAQALRTEAELRARYDALRAARAALTGFDAGARNILSARLPGVRGSIARLIDVKPGYERTIAAALASDLQAILVDDWSNAQAARSHLNEEAGRATIVPLNALRQQAYLLPFGVHRAIEYITCAEAIRPALEALLSHYVVVDDLAQARELLSTLPRGVHAVTQSGDVLRSNGAIVLGGAAGSGDLITHEREWRELPESIRTAADRVASIESRRAEEAARADEVVRRQAALADDVRSLGESAAARGAARAEALRQIESIDLEREWKNRLIEQAETELRELADRDAALAQAIEQRAADQVAQQQAAAALEQQLAALPIDPLASQLTALQTSAAISEQLRQGQDSVLLSHRSALEQAQAQLAARSQRIAALISEQAGIGSQVGALREQELTLAGQLEAYRARIDPAEAEVRALEAEFAAAENEERAARTRLQEIESRYNLALMDAARKEDELNHLRARIDEELGLVQLELADLTAPQPLPLKPIVTELPTVSELPENLEQEMQRLKAHIRRLGPINPEAQAEYRSERERYEFLGAQSDDLTKAVEQLRQVIAELDQTMEKSFVETFSAVAEEFKATFQVLFGGGSARLVLTDPDNITQSGIDIIARPPGKKQQGLALLSGGERSLTAAALLFAILKVKPPPFCMLDETDAALDEANVGRFREMIRWLSAQTQFVLITHNRGTIEAADTIYGITMERDSSSRAYSLKLEGDRVAA